MLTFTFCSGNLTVYVEAAHDGASTFLSVTTSCSLKTRADDPFLGTAYRRLLPSRYPSLSPSNPPRFSPYARPSILLITAEPDIPARLRASTPFSRPFLVVQTPEPAVRAPLSEAVETRARLAKQAAGAAEGAAAAGADAPKAYGGARKKAGRKGAANQKGRKAHARRDGEVDSTGQEEAATPPPPPPDLSAGYTQAAFNALPMLERVVHTQAFVRDLTVLAREADAAVVSGASNVGRLAMLCVDHFLPARKRTTWCWCTGAGQKCSSLTQSRPQHRGKGGRDGTSRRSRQRSRRAHVRATSSRHSPASH